MEKLMVWMTKTTITIAASMNTSSAGIPPSPLGSEPVSFMRKPACSATAFRKRSASPRKRSFNELDRRLALGLTSSVTFEAFSLFSRSPVSSDFFDACKDVCSKANSSESKSSSWLETSTSRLSSPQLEPHACPHRKNQTETAADRIGVSSVPAVNEIKNGILQKCPIF